MLEENSESNWIIDSSAKKGLVQRFLTPMTGSVVTAGDPTGKSRTARAKGKAKAKPRAKPKAGASGQAAANIPSMPEEADVHESTVACQVGVRQKLWLDDLLACATHVCVSVSAMGVEDVQVKTLKSHLLRTGLLFALKGSAVLETAKGTKTYKKWSTMRPALKEHALLELIQAQLSNTCHMLGV